MESWFSKINPRFISGLGNGPILGYLYAALVFLTKTCKGCSLGDELTRTQLKGFPREETMNIASVANAALWILAFMVPGSF